MALLVSVYQQLRARQAHVRVQYIMGLSGSLLRAKPGLHQGSDRQHQRGVGSGSQAFGRLHGCPGWSWWGRKDFALHNSLTLHTFALTLDNA